MSGRPAWVGVCALDAVLEVCIDDGPIGGNDAIFEELKSVLSLALNLINH